MSVRVYVQCELDSDKLDGLEMFLKENLPRVRSFLGCLSVAVYFSPDKKTMRLEEEWSSIDNHQAYIKYIKYNGVFQALSEYCHRVPELDYFDKALW
jgi:quinol monooxygenase YgiN